MSKQNKDIARRVYEEVANTGNLALLDQLMAANIVYHGPGMEIKGVQGAKEMINGYRTAFPDLRMTVEDQVAEGDKVVTRWSARGTHRGDLQGIAPTGKKVTVTGINIDRIAGGKIAEEWEIFDLMGMMQQLGVIPAPGQP